ncbi:MAG: hypothetical protein WC880_02095 [Candidatus Paceibacterota bacterium]
MGFLDFEFKSKKRPPVAPVERIPDVRLRDNVWDGQERPAGPPRSRVGAEADGVDGHVAPWPTQPNFEEHV